METTTKEVSFELLLDDYHAMLKHVCAPASSGLWMVERLLWLAAIFIASFSLVLLGRAGRIFLAGTFVGFVLMLVKSLLTQRRLRPLSDGAVLGRYDVRLTPGGVHVQTAKWTCDVPWHGVFAVEETASHCFLRTDTVSAYPIPKRSFPNSEAKQQFIGFARECVSRARK